MKSSAIVLSLCLIGLIAQSQRVTQTKWKHQFADFGVKNVLKGKPAPVVLLKGDRMWRTRLREGAAKGPNFAGHYTITTWGCGSSCLVVAVIDATSGKFEYADFMPLGVPFENSESGREYQGLVYRLDSSLLIADGCPRDEDVSPPPCGTYYYVMRDGVLKQIDFVSDPPMAKH